jgi:hypothetical protein
LTSWRVDVVVDHDVTPSGALHVTGDGALAVDPGRIR